MTIYEALNWATHYLKDHRIENPRLQAELLLGYSMNLKRESLYLCFPQEMGKGEEEKFKEIVQRRVKGEPLQYLLGYQEFWSIPFKVDPRVLIPRPETELLVEEGISILLKNTFERIPYVLELGTGCGAIAISLAKEIKPLLIVATDLSKEAIEVAKENAKEAGVFERIIFLIGDLFEPFTVLKRSFDLILSNPPYIKDSEIESLPKEIKNHEPLMALKGGEDGLDFYRRIIFQAPQHLKQKGWLLLELGEGQGEKVTEIFEGAGEFQKPILLKDLSGIDRVIKAQKI
ncbi:MAG: peptide chain release factor N(5)-glutamine methyltransferase [Thermodesulfobacteriota bacterium]